MTSAFKAYDIRGEIPGQVNVPFAYRLGQAVATELSPQSVVVGHDMRMDSPGLAQAIIQGLLDSGVDVLPLGRCGTEEVYFNTAFNGTDAGLMVTASHNPMNYNGIKMVLKGAQAATRDNALGPLEKLVYSDRKFTVVTEYARRGRLFAQMDKKAYVERLLSQVADIDLSPLKIVCHAGNGCAGPVIDLLEESLPFTFIKVDHEPDSSLPNGIPNPLLPEKRERASRAVIEHGADLGLAWDGDFDRCFFYDEKGRFIEGYYLVGLIAQTLLRTHTGGTILYDPRLIWNTIDVVEAAGGTAKVCRTGHAFFKQMLREEDGIYGGEMSAHHYFRDFSYCDTGMLPWLAVVAELSSTGAKLSELVDERIAAFPCSGEINFTVDDARTVQNRIADHFAATNPSIETIDGLSMAFDDWRFNVRASNTEPLLRLNVESRADIDLVARKVEEISEVIAND
jgi:phosphomannomutase